MGFNLAAEGIESAWKPRGKGSSPGDEGPALRFRTSNSDEDYRSNPGTVPDRSSPNPALPSRGPHHGHDPSPDGSGQAVADGDNLGEVRRHSVGFCVGALLHTRSTPGKTRDSHFLSPATVGGRHLGREGRRQG